MKRIVSLLPSATDTIVAVRRVPAPAANGKHGREMHANKSLSPPHLAQLGISDWVVARSHECDQPEV